MVAQPYPKEEWRAISEDGWSYEVSNYGCVRGRQYRAKGQPNKDRIPRIKTQFYNKNGYPQVNVMLSGGIQTVVVHILVATAFLGPRPEGYQINHKNSIRDDNRLANLEYCTASENISHSYRTKIRKTNFGHDHPKSTVTAEMLPVIWSMIKAGKINKEIAEFFQIDPSTISRIKSHNIWRKQSEALGF